MSASHEVHKHNFLAPDDSEWPDMAWRNAFACPKCALRMLLMLLNSPQWVMRRVERVAFHDDRTARRRVSMDFLIPLYSPRYQLVEGHTTCLIPLTVMRRKTLVNFNVTDVDGRALSLMSMRHNQVLTEHIILVLADVTPGVNPLGVQEFAHQVAYGTQEELVDSFRLAETGKLGRDVDRLIADQGAERILRRLANNFILLVFVDDVGPQRQIVRFSYDEPLTLTYKRSGYDPEEKRYTAEPEPLRRLSPRRLAAATGWSPTMIRFPTPAAENTASYHFEIEAPPGVMVASASLVAGRPNEDRPVYWDHVAGGLPVVGLHVVDVPNGSMSRAQVALRLNRRGWLTASLLASILSVVLLWLTVGAAATGGEAPAVAAAILTITAAVIVFVAKPVEHQMVSRLVTSVRAAVGTTMLLLVLVGSLITFWAPAAGWLIAAAVCATACSALVGVAWWRAQPSNSQISPWEQGLGITENRPDQPSEPRKFEATRQEFGFDRPAVMVASSEGDHREAFHWTKAIDEEMNRRLAEALSDERRATKTERTDGDSVEGRSQVRASEAGGNSSPEPRPRV